MARRHALAVVYDCLYPYSTGGGERQYRAFAERMVTADRRVDYLTSRQWDDRPAPERFGIIAVTPELRLYDDAGVRSSSAALRFALGVFRSLLRRRRDYDAVLVSGLPVLNVFAARAALAGSGTRLIVDYLEVWGRKQWLAYTGPVMGTVAWLLQRAAIALTPVATCHSDLSARRLRAEGLRGRLLVSPGLIDSAVEHDAVEHAATPPYVLYAGRHIADKRVEALPAAVAHARATIPDLELVILGSGSSTADVAGEVERVDGAAWTRMPGFVEQDELDRLMGHAACLANPSRREGYGLVVVESSAFGTPVVLVDDEGNAATELISPGVNGFVADSVEPEALGDAIVRAVQAGDPLRASTRAWHDDALRTRSIDGTVDRIIHAVYGTDSPDRPARHTASPSEGTP